MNTKNSNPLFTLFRSRLMKLSLLSAAAIGIMLSLSACNTMHGLGKDVEKTGEAIQKSTR